MDAELQQVFNLAVSSGVTLFDTADSYGAPRNSSGIKSLPFQLVVTISTMYCTSEYFDAFERPRCSQQAVFMCLACQPLVTNLRDSRHARPSGCSMTCWWLDAACTSHFLRHHGVLIARDCI